jgi:hypothetical protein
MNIPSPVNKEDISEIVKIPFTILSRVYVLK